MRPTAALLAVLLAAASLPAQTPPRIFVFRESFSINLHHFLYVLGRVEASMPDVSRRAVAGAPADQEAGLSRLTDGERQIWRESVSAYAKGPSRQDLVFDDELVRVTGMLARAARTEPRLDPERLPPAIATTLEQAGPVYRKAWWPEHEAANRRRTAEMQALVDRHGAAMLAYITRAYRQSWPAEGFPIQMSAYSNWAGAYSTRGQVLVFSSLDPGLAGGQGLETLFHEAMHQWDDPIFAALRRAAARVKVPRIPGDLSHAMIFFTAGEAARQVMPGHVTYAEGRGFWIKSNFAPFKPALDQHWKPWLEGNGTFDAALDALVAAIPR